MAESEFSKNGDNPRPPGSPEDIKIVMVGEPKCGKTTFIKTIYEFNELTDLYQAHNCTIYCINYNMSNRTRHIRVFEFNSCRGVEPSEALKEHGDANGFIFMYAIDDPLSFQRVTDKWYANLEGELKNEEQAILVGNKKDLRDDPRVIQHLAGRNLIPVTEEQGQNLVKEKTKIGKYFDCSSTQNQNVNEAFENILGGAFANLINKIYPFDETNYESEDQNVYNSESENQNEYNIEFEDENDSDSETESEDDV